MVCCQRVAQLLPEFGKRSSAMYRVIEVKFCRLVIARCLCWRNLTYEQRRIRRQNDADPFVGKCVGLTGIVLFGHGSSLLSCCGNPILLWLEFESQCEL